MIILGLLVGPAIGLLLSDLFTRSLRLALWQTLAAGALIAIFLFFAPVFQMELKIGLLGGYLLGALLATTPILVYEEAE